MKIDLPADPQRILIVKPSSLGDIVHALPILKPLRQRFPGAKISWLVMPAFASLLEGHPQIDRVIPFERKRLASWWRNPLALLHLFDLRQELRNQFDLVIDLQGLLRSAWLTYLTKSPVKVGFDNAREGSRWFYSHRVPVPSDDVHAVDRYLSVAEALRCEKLPAEFVFASNESDRSAVTAMLNGIDRFAVLMPGTNWVTKRWPSEYFAQTVAPLREQFGLKVIVAGGADIAALASQIPADLNLAGKTNLRQLVALLERSDLVIANDSGPMHIAAALGKPLVTMYGPTNPLRTGPYAREDSVIRVDIPCSPCYSRQCSHISCMKWLKPQNVIDAALVQIGKR
jgi:lipopolysaccharide heptosyltransferase I